MEDKELLTQLSQLRKIKPREDWVLASKNRIMEQEQVAPESVFTPIVRLQTAFSDFVSALRYLEKPAFVMPVLGLVVFGGMMAHVSNSSMPGDTLYAVRSTVEQVGLTFSSDASLASIGVAQNRLRDLEVIAEDNRVENLSATIKEYESSVAAASKELAVLVEKEPKKALQVSLELVKLQEGKARIEQVLGAAIGVEEDNILLEATKMLVEREIADLETRTLTEEQSALLEQAKLDFEKEDYQSALEKVWMLSNIN